MEWLWSLFNSMKCVAVVGAHDENFKSLKLFPEYYHNPNSGLTPSARRTLRRPRSLGKFSKGALARGHVLEEVNVNEEIDVCDASQRQTRSCPAEACRKAYASFVQTHPPDGSVLTGRPSGMVTYNGKDYVVRIMPGMLSDHPHRCSWAFPGKLINASWKKDSIRMRQLLNIVATDPKTRFTVLVITRPSAAEHKQERLVLKVRASRGHAAKVFHADGNVSRSEFVEPSP